MADESFLGRWSRLKREQRRIEPVQDAPAPLPAVASVQPVPQKNDAPAPMIRAEDLPPVDSLTAESDFTVFLEEGVPEELKKLALRRLWSTDPFLAQPDPLDIHNLDYTMPAVAEVVKTVYQVGRGIVLPEEEARPEAAAPNPAAREPEIAERPEPSEEQAGESTLAAVATSPNGGPEKPS